jgi:phage terminase large subunit-like protein
MRGRKPLSNAVRLLRASRRPQNPDEPKLPSASVVPPASLAGDALAVWNEAIPALALAGVVSVADIGRAARACTWEALGRQLLAEAQQLRGKDQADRIRLAAQCHASSDRVWTALGVVILGNELGRVRCRLSAMLWRCSRRGMPRTPTRDQRRHSVSRYAQDVLQGRILAGRYMHKAAQRHLDDLQRADLVFDTTAATRAIAFFETFLRHPDGSPFVLLPWEVFAVGQVFGWKQASRRRYKYLYLSTAKGAGKSPLVSGIALAAWFLDDEPAAELYTAATTKEQSMVQYRDCARMARSAALAKELEIGDYNIARPSTGSFLRPISSEGKALDGKRVSVALIDELQEHGSPDVLDKMVAGVKNRPQPIICITANAGYGAETVADHLHTFARRILDEGAQHDAWLPLIFSLDPCDRCRAAGHWQPNEECPDCDDWRNEAAWGKPNPSLDTVLPREYLRQAVAEAQDRPSKQSIVMRLNFSLWTSASVRWLPSDQWTACGTEPIDPASLTGPCILGVDLGESADMTSIVALFGDEDAGYVVQVFYFAAEDGLDARAAHDRAPYRQWARDGLLTLVPGDAVTFEHVRTFVKDYGGSHDIREVCVDRWRAKQLERWLVEDGFNVVEVAPTLANIAPAAATLERLLKTRKIKHANHPILSWNAANTVADIDSNGNVKPSKARSGGRIDGVAALCVALVRALAAPQYSSVYDHRGALIL